MRSAAAEPSNRLTGPGRVIQSGGGGTRAFFHPHSTGSYSPVRGDLRVRIGQRSQASHLPYLLHSAQLSSSVSVVPEGLGVQGCGQIQIKSGWSSESHANAKLTTEPDVCGWGNSSMATPMPLIQCCEDIFCPSTHRDISRHWYCLCFATRSWPSILKPVLHCGMTQYL